VRLFESLQKRSKALETISITPASLQTRKTLEGCCNSSKQLGVSSRTLRRWHAQGLIKAERTYSGVRLYNINHVLSSPTNTFSASSSAPFTPTEQPSKYIYARVSSPKQRSDLERQKQHLQQLYPSHLILTDIASGINWKRPGLKTLLERSSHGLVTEVVVAHRDRLCRFAFDLIEYVLRLNGTKIVVVQSSDDTSSSASAANELAQDILAINTVFICRMQGRRSAENRQRRRNEETQSRSNPKPYSEETENREIGEELEGSDLPKCETERFNEEMDGMC